jgi:hypothetical protein
VRSGSKIDNEVDHEVDKTEQGCSGTKKIDSGNTVRQSQSVVRREKGVQSKNED